METTLIFFHLKISLLLSVLNYEIKMPQKKVSNDSNKEQYFLEGEY